MILNVDCPKGKPGMLLQAAVDQDIDLPRSFMIGDKMSDIEAGNTAGCHSLLVRSGYEKTVKLSAKAQYEANFGDLSEATDYILRKIDIP